MREYIIAEKFEELEAISRSLLKTLSFDELDYEEVSLKTRLLTNKFDELIRLLPPLKTSNINDFYRHLGFVKRHPEKWGDNNLKDIINYDIPGIKMAYYENLKEFPHLDQELRQQCEGLILNDEYDSAIRKAFLVLKDRAVNKFGAQANCDGEQLINYLFSADSGVIQVDPDRNKRLAFRNFVGGLNGYFRNTYAHNLVNDPVYVAEAVLSAINMILKLIDRVQTP